MFQALRIEVNQGHNQLKTALDHPSLLASDGRIAIISFHSLEDNIVKRFFKSHKELFKPLNKKVIKAKKRLQTAVDLIVRYYVFINDFNP